MKSLPLLLLGLAGLGLVAWAAAPRAEDDGKPVLQLGSTVPAALALRDFEGRRTSFEDLRGKVVALHFWSDRCPAEVHADPVFKAMEELYAGNEKVALIGIASNQNELGPAPGEDADWSKHYESLRKKRDKVGYRHPILADHGNVVSDLFQARSTPHCFVIDAEGVLRYSGALDDDPRGSKGERATNYVKDAVAAVLAGRKPEVETTKPYG